MAISRSNRPGRRRAGSIALGRFVAAITIRCFRWDSPSMRANNWATTRFSTSPDDALALWRDGVDFIEEDDGGGVAAGFLEDLPQVGLTLAVELVDDLRPAHGIEVRVGLMRDGPRNQRLAASRRPVQEHALGRRRFPAARRPPDTAGEARSSRGSAATAASGRRCPHRKSSARNRRRPAAEACR